MKSIFLLEQLVIEAADIVLMNDDSAKLITALKIAKRTKQVALLAILNSLGLIKAKNY